MHSILKSPFIWKVDKERLQAVVEAKDTQLQQKDDQIQQKDDRIQQQGTELQERTLQLNRQQREVQSLRVRKWMFYCMEW